MYTGPGDYEIMSNKVVIADDSHQFGAGKRFLSPEKAPEGIYNNLCINIK
jgi:hypothetical protein